MKYLLPLAIALVFTACNDAKKAEDTNTTAPVEQTATETNTTADTNATATETNATDANATDANATAN